VAASEGVAMSHKVKRYLMWDGLNLYFSYDGAEVRDLGKINTRQGSLTREQKLKAVAHTREWVEI